MEGGESGVHDCGPVEPTTGQHSRHSRGPDRGVGEGVTGGDLLVLYPPRLGDLLVLYSGLVALARKYMSDCLIISAPVRSHR